MQTFRILFLFFGLLATVRSNDWSFDGSGDDDGDISLTRKTFPSDDEDMTEGSGGFPDEETQTVSTSTEAPLPTTSYHLLDSTFAFDESARYDEEAERITKIEMTSTANNNTSIPSLVPVNESHDQAVNHAADPSMPPTTTTEQSESEKSTLNDLISTSTSIDIISQSNTLLPIGNDLGFNFDDNEEVEIDVIDPAEDEPEVGGDPRKVKQEPEEEKAIDKETDDEVMEPEGKVATSSVADTPHFLAAVIVGGVIGLLFAVCVIMLLVYRMRKKDEGSYAIDFGVDSKKPHGNYEYTKGVDSKEYYA